MLYKHNIMLDKKNKWFVITNIKLFRINIKLSQTNIIKEMYK